MHSEPCNNWRVHVSKRKAVDNLFRTILTIDFSLLPNVFSMQNIFSLSSVPFCPHSKNHLTLFNILVIRILRMFFEIFFFFAIIQTSHCVKSVRIWSYSGPHSVRMRGNTDQNNCEYRHFSRNECCL